MSKFNQRAQFKEERKLERQIYVNIPLPASELAPNGSSLTTYVNNSVKTAKYNLFTFIPKNLFEQFRGLANVYFLGTVLIQAVPGIKTIPIEIAMIPLVFILVLTALKDAIEVFIYCTVAYC